MTFMPSASAPFYVEYESPSPFAREGKPGKWRVRERATGRILYTKARYDAAEAICDGMNRRAVCPDPIQAKNRELLPSDFTDTYAQIRMDQLRNSLADFARDSGEPDIAAWIERRDDFETSALLWLLDQPDVPVSDDAA